MTSSTMLVSERPFQPRDCISFNTLKLRANFEQVFFGGDSQNKISTDSFTTTKKIHRPDPPGDPTAKARDLFESLQKVNVQR